MSENVVPAVVVTAVVVLVGLAAAGTFSPKEWSGSTSAPTPPEVVTVASTGTVWNLDASTYEYTGPVDLTDNSSWTVTGSFTANNGITFYILTSSEYSAWGGPGSPCSYAYASGSDVTSASIDTIIAGNSYYFVWENANLVTAASVEITSALICTASG